MFEYLTPVPGGRLWMREGCGIWLARAGEQPDLVYKHDGLVTAHAVTADGLCIASGDVLGQILVYSLCARRFVGVMRAWGRRVICLAWDSEETVLVSLSADPDDDPITEHWQLPGERLEVLLNWEWDGASQWAPGYGACVTIQDGVPEVASLASEQWCSYSYLGHRRCGWKVIALAWSPDGRFIASVDKHAIQVWEAATGECRGVRWHLSRVTGIAWLDQVTLVTAETGTLKPLRRWYLSASVTQAPPTLPGFPALTGRTPIWTSYEWKHEAGAEDGDPAMPQGILRNWSSLMEEAIQAGREWAEESPEEATDLGAIYRERKEAPHRRYPNIMSETEEAIYEEAWAVGALTAQSTS